MRCVRNGSFRPREWSGLIVGGDEEINDSRDDGGENKESHEGQNDNTASYQQGLGPK